MHSFGAGLPEVFGWRETLQSFEVSNQMTLISKPDGLSHLSGIRACDQQPARVKDV
jgi:hypothetical protein